MIEIIQQIILSNFININLFERDGHHKIFITIYLLYPQPRILNCGRSGATAPF